MRGSIVDTGEIGQTANIERVQAAFARHFCSLVSWLSSSKLDANQTVRHLRGDV
jgi:hypothetical protein